MTCTDRGSIRWIVGFVSIVLAGGPWAAADFNGDGFADLAVGVGFEDVGTLVDAGLVNVVYGRAAGLDDIGNQTWDQDAGLEEVCEEGDYFGSALAVGDFNGDGFGDLAVGVSHEDVGGEIDAGAVAVLYGFWWGGLGDLGNQLWTQDNASTMTTSEDHDLFGSSLAVGDFDGDGYDDLAVGSPGEHLGPNDGAGGVLVLFGSASGLTSAGSEWWSSADVDGDVEAAAFFGSSLAGGDFDGDGYDDLAIGAPYRDAEGITDSGAVFITNGGAGGLYNASGDDCWHQGRDGVSDESEVGDGFGKTLSVGDFDGDGFADLVVGVPEEDIGSVTDAGALYVLPGTVSGVASTAAMRLHQDNFPSNSPAEAQDRFASALAAGDLDGDGHDDLVIGVPNEDWGATADSGMVHVLWGSGGGIVMSGALWLTEDELVPGSAVGAYEVFGTALVVGDFDGDGRGDLAISAPGEDRLDGATPRTDAGIVFILEGEAGGLGLIAQVFDQCLELAGGCEDYDRFGTVLAAPSRSGFIFGDGFETGGTGAWHAVSP